MGMDITLSIIENKQYLAKNIFDGRSREWFDNMRGRGNDFEYDFLPVDYPCFFPEGVFPEDLDFDLLEEAGYFDFRTIKVDDYIDWFRKYRPDIDAGWVNSYDKWRIETKGYIPEDVDHYLDPEANPADMHFIEIKKKYDCAKWLYDYIIDNNISSDAYIFYYFDC